MEKVTLSVEEMGKTLGISRTKAYEFAHKAPFLVHNIDKSIRIPIKPFLNWLNGENALDQKEGANNGK